MQNQTITIHKTAFLQRLEKVNLLTGRGRKTKIKTPLTIFTFCNYHKFAHTPKGGIVEAT